MVAYNFSTGIDDVASGAKRIQRRRAKGWKIPANTVIVSRPSPWGNPFVVGRDGTREECVTMYKMLLSGNICLTCKVPFEEQKAANNFVAKHIHELKGKNLACWCRDDGKPCHADVLLKLAEAA